MIRKSFVLLALLALSAAPARAQGLEFSGGVNMAKLSGDAVADAARNLGMNIGLDLVIPVGPIGINIGGDFTQLSSDRTVGSEAQIVDLSYIQLPLHVRLPLVGAGPLRLNVVLGPTLGINTGCEITTDLDGVRDCSDVGLGGIDARSLDWSGTAGLGLSFRVGGLAYAGVDLLGTFGLTDVESTAV
jgi:hypothetical protein